MSVSIVNIARKAGVSHVTVSMALRDDPRISEDRRKSIKKLAQEMGYRPSPLARGLRGKSTSTLCILWPHDGPRSNMNLLRTLTQRAQRRGYTALMYDSLSDCHVTENVLSDCLTRGVDAVVLSYTGNIPGDPGVAQLLSQFRVKVLIAESLDTVTLESDVIVHNRAAGIYSAVDHFFATGRKRPAIVVYEGSSPEKVKAFLARLSQHGIPLSLDRCISVPYSNKPAVVAADYVQAMENCFPDRFPYDAVLCVPDVGAARLIGWLKQKGYRVPEDVAIVGFDDVELCEDLTPPLASVQRHDVRLAEAIEELVFSRLEIPDLPVRTVRIDMEFVRRESAG